MDLLLFLRIAVKEQKILYQKNEFKDFFTQDYEILMPEDKTVEGNFNKLKIVKGLKELQNDPSVDVVMTFGHLSSFLACQLKKHGKPVIASTIISSFAGNLPKKGNSSGIKNLYIETL